MVVAILLAGWLWQQKGDRISVLVVDHAVPAGATVTANDLTVSEVSGVDNAIASTDSDQVVGAIAAVGLVKGQILTYDMVTRTPIPGTDQRIVGMELDAPHAPTGLRPGDAVEVLAVPPIGDPGTTAELDDPPVLAADATVVTVRVVRGSGTRLTVLVPVAVADRVAAYVAAGRVALVQAPIGGDD
ncbi:MAG: SAF domain-containing protein [Nocardioides sp.]